MELARDYMHYVEEGNKYRDKGDYDAAGRCFEKAIALNPQAVIYESLGSVRQLAGDPNGAITCYENALKAGIASPAIKKNLASLFSETSSYPAAITLMQGALSESPNDETVLELLIKFALVAGEFTEAAAFAEQYASACFGVAAENTPEKELISISPLKLKHDIEQFSFLKRQGINVDGLDQIALQYEEVFKAIESLGPEKVALDAHQTALVKPAYRKILYRPDTPRVTRALSGNWDIATASDSETGAEQNYLDSNLGITIIDNLLSEEALLNLRKFCLESTIWFRDKYAFGRLGAFFREGFNCPLLIQIAEEIKAAFPTIIGEKHALLQLWAFKFDHFQPATSPHGDFAAVNVNFWITPEEENLDEDTGGMVIYDVEAPLNWDFDSYNNDGRRIVSFLREKDARAFTIPYKANRAIIFNSDLFHATSPVQFRDGYESRRINVTLLFGKRELA